MKRQRPIRVLHVSSATIGGVGANFLALARGMRQPDIELEFALPDDSHFFHAIRDTGVPVHEVPMDRQPFRASNIKSLAMLLALCARGRYDLVHTHCAVGGVLGRVAGKCFGDRTLWSSHGWSFNYTINEGTKGVLFRNIERLMGRLTDRYIMLSREMLRIGNDAGIRAVTRSSLIPHGIELPDPGDPREKRRELGVADAEILLGWAGRIEPQKAPDVLLESCARVMRDRANVKLLLVGDGPDRDAAHALADRLGIAERTIFAGWQPDAPNWMRAMDVFLLPSAWEASPIVLIEAMALSKPIVATRVGGVPETIIDGEGGLIADAGDVDTVSTHIAALADDADLRTRLGTFNRTRAETEHTLDAMCGRYADVYRWLMTPRTTRRATPAPEAVSL